jgi:hypothetical protein
MHGSTRLIARVAVAAGALLLAACGGQQQGSMVGLPPVGNQAVSGAVPAGPQPDSGTIILNPTSLPIRGTGAAFNRTFTATDTQKNFHGTFTAKSSNTAIATVYPSQVSGQQSATFTVTPVSIGQCSIIVKDGKSTKSLKVTVTTAHGIYVTNRGSESIEVFDLAANGNVGPSATWSGTKTGFDAINLLTVDASANVWESNIGPGITGSVEMFPANPTGNTAPAVFLSGSNTGIDTPEGIFIDKSGNTWVANVDRIVEFAPGANGNATPINTIVGSNTLLSGPYELTLDSSGNIYTAEGNVILVYAAGATGNATPIQEIAGPATGLLSCLGIAVDSSGNIWATNFNGNTINEYAKGANGNAQPTNVITSTALNEPYNIALDSNGNMYVTNFGNNSVVVFPAGSKGASNPSATISGSITKLSQPQGIAVF